MDDQIKSVPGHPRYKADVNGNVYRDGKLIEGSFDGKYIIVANLRGGKIKKATLVCLAYHGPKPLGKEVCHKNDIGIDDRPENLYWGTHLENMRDAFRNGLHNRKGEKNGRCILSDEDCQRIRKLYNKKAGINQTYLANIFGVHQTQISRILRGVQR